MSAFVNGKEIKTDGIRWFAGWERKVWNFIREICLKLLLYYLLYILLLGTLVFLTGILEEPAAVMGEAKISFETAAKLLVGRQHQTIIVSLLLTGHCIWGTFLFLCRQYYAPLFAGIIGGVLFYMIPLAFFSWVAIPCALLSILLQLYIFNKDRKLVIMEYDQVYERAQYEGEVRLLQCCQEVPAKQEM